MVALVQEDARQAGGRLAQKLGEELQVPGIAIDTFRYDVGVVALLGLGGLSMVFSNLLLGGMLVLAAPVLAMYMRGRVKMETRNKAKELATKAMKEAAAKVQPKLEEMIDGFAQRLDAWVVSAGEEMYQQVLDVLRTAREERERGEATRVLAVSECDKHATLLGEIQKRLEEQRAALTEPTEFQNDPS
jgi:hypothetical protein